MGYDNNCILKINQEIFQPSDRLDIQTIGRLVQKQNIWLAKKSLGKKNFNLVAVRQFTHILVMQVFWNVEVLQQLRSFAFSFPATQLSKFSFQLSCSNPILVREVRLHINSIFLFHNAVKVLVPHDNDINDPLILIVKMILTQNRESLIWP